MHMKKLLVSPTYKETTETQRSFGCFFFVSSPRLSFKRTELRTEKRMLVCVVEEKKNQKCVQACCLLLRPKYKATSLRRNVFLE